MPYATPKYQVQAEECELATSRVASPTAWARPGLPPSFIVARPSAFNPRSAHHRPSPKQKTETSAQLHGSSVVGPGLTLGCCGLARRARATQDVEVHSLRLQYGAYRYWPTKPLPPLPLPPWPRPFPTGGCGCAATRAAPLRTRPSYNRTSVVLPSDTCQGWVGGIRRAKKRGRRRGAKAQPHALLRAGGGEHCACGGTNGGAPARTRPEGGA